MLVHLVLSYHEVNWYKTCCVNCLNHLLYTQHKFFFLINMLRLNLAERNRLLGVVRTVVAGQYNVSRSTISRLVERVNVMGTADDRLRSGAPRVISIRQDIWYDNIIYVTGSFMWHVHLCDRFIYVTGSFMWQVHDRTIHLTCCDWKSRKTNSPWHSDKSFAWSGIHCCHSAWCQALTRHQYFLCFFFVSV